MTSVITPKRYSKKTELGKRWSNKTRGNHTGVFPQIRANATKMSPETSPSEFWQTRLNFLRPFPIYAKIEKKKILKEAANLFPRLVEKTIFLHKGPT